MGGYHSQTLQIKRIHRDMGTFRHVIAVALFALGALQLLVESVRIYFLQLASWRHLRHLGGVDTVPERTFSNFK